MSLRTPPRVQVSGVVVVQLLSCVRLFAAPWTAAHQASLSFTISQSLLKLMSIKSVMVSNYLILCCPLLLLSSIFPSESACCIRWPKYWSFSFCNSPSNEYSGLISFRIDWLDFLAVQGTLQSLLENLLEKSKSGDGVSSGRGETDTLLPKKTLKVATNGKWVT